jgi:hypothetical protein
MTQEQKDLLLKDLCARLPYGVKGCYQNSDDELLRKVTIMYRYLEHGGMVMTGDIKPYLIPLSSMTVEQRCKVQNLLPNHCDISFKNQKITFYDEGNIQLEQLEKVFNFFNMHHIDYRGLIPMDLAIDATGLNIYYKL